MTAQGLAVALVCAMSAATVEAGVASIWALNDGEKVERVRRGFLKCGIVSHGFARAECQTCRASGPAPLLG